MSFSHEIKNELAHLEPDSRCCEIAELAGLVRMDGTILIGNRKGIGLELVTENNAVARKAYKGLMQYLFHHNSFHNGEFHLHLTSIIVRCQR